MKIKEDIPFQKILLNISLFMLLWKATSSFLYLSFKINWKQNKGTLILQKSALILKNVCALLVCIYGLSSHFKCSFKSILGKKNFPARFFFSVSHVKRLSKCPYSKKPPLPRKIPGCVPADITFLYIRTNF